MPADPVQRRLAAILVADVVGYSRLMGRDEEGTLATLTAHRTKLIEPCIAEHRGRVVKTTGDGLLAEFASVVDAVRCAVAFQEGMAGRNTDVPEDRRIEFRIGVNLGDVIVQDDDVYGDGVNVAARLEGVADPGGVVVSGKVRDEVHTKLEVGFDDLGPQEVKNISEPVRAYRISAMGSSVRMRGEAVFRLPSIAVLPFENMSGNPEQEYFSDGITEDLITALSRIRQFRVVARNSTFQYKGKSADVRQVAKELDVQYVIEGSVRKFENRVRISAQLIDGTSGEHIWADRTDRNVEDVFAVQDEITQTIVGAIHPELGKSERLKAKQKSSDVLNAWDCYQRGMWFVHRRKPAERADAKACFRRAIEIHPGFAPAYSGLAQTLFFELFDGHAESPFEATQEAHNAARKAVELDNDDADAHLTLALIHQLRREHDLAIAECEHAIRLNASFAEAYHSIGGSLSHSGRAREGLPYIDTAIR